jgi:hypothetical protein
MVRSAKKLRRYGQALVVGGATLFMLQPLALAQDRTRIEVRAVKAIELLAGYDQRATAAFSRRSFAELDALNRDLRQTIIEREKERVDGAVMLLNCDGSIFGLSALVGRAVLKLKRPDRFAAVYDANATKTLDQYTRSLHRCAMDAGLDTFKTGLSDQAVNAL